MLYKLDVNSKKTVCIPVICVVQVKYLFIVIVQKCNIKSKKYLLERKDFVDCKHKMAVMNAV